MIIFLVKSQNLLSFSLSYAKIMQSRRSTKRNANIFNVYTSVIQADMLQ